MLHMAEQPLANDSSAHRRRLGVDLRRSREALNLTQQQAAERLEWSLSKLIRIENGTHAVSVSDVRSMIGVYEIGDQRQVDALLATARAGRGKAWWNPYRDVVPTQFARYLGYEASAARFRVFHPFLVPGLLQTGEYATELLKTLPDPRRAQLLLDLKRERQERVFAQAGLSFIFIVGEEGLYRWIGGRDVMRRQLEHLAEAASRPKVELRIMPFDAGAYPGMTGPLVLLRLAEDGEEVVFLESVGGDQLIRDEPDPIERYANYFETMNEKSLSPKRSEALLRERIGQLRRTAGQDADGAGAS
jgi:transcriptional regulator with XRE-family HTH domain